MGIITLNSGCLQYIKKSKTDQKYLERKKELHWQFIINTHISKLFFSKYKHDSDNYRKNLRSISVFGLGLLQDGKFK